MILEVRDIKKSFGTTKVLDGINLSIQEGECYCLIGRNGAGKSTLIHIIIDLLETDRGVVKLFGSKYSDSSQLIKSNIGVLPEFNPVINEFTGIDYLRYVGMIYELPKKLMKKRIRILSNYFFEDSTNLKKKIGQYSKGMKIKIGICAAVIHKPKFLVLDEPFENLDPLASNNLATFISDYRKQGNALLVSSHEINYVQKIATHLGILETHKLIYSGSLEKILNENEKKFDDQVSSMLGYTPKSLDNF
ncbi:ABC transporter ATP-binding protein [Fodinibius saliphilus]|uniref:ABC transporter ATP-binding protein n=1 Tax=Fodinibius saliphilus TaxID=1920650 RepID=UPI001108FBBB|nr:ABC transporter ATP-binding protein [Fodinibius saliphilus]